MTTPHPTSKAERREINAAASIALLTIIILGPTYLSDLATGRFSTALSAAVPEGLSKHNLDGGPFWLLTAALVVKIAAILIIAFFAYRLVKPMLRGQVFNTKNIRLLTGMTIGIFVWFIGRFVLEGLGNNWASAQLGIDWGGQPGRNDIRRPCPPLPFHLHLAALLSRHPARLQAGRRGGRPCLRHQNPK